MVDRATKAFRSIGPSNEDDLAADKAAAQRQLEQQMEQLQQLSGGAMGRAAREAAKRQLLERDPQAQQGGGERQAGEVGVGRGGRGGGGDNPFAMSSDERARWEADDHLYTEGATARAAQQRRRAAMQRARSPSPAAPRGAQPEQAPHVRQQAGGRVREELGPVVSGSSAAGEHQSPMMRRFMAERDASHERAAAARGAAAEGELRMQRQQQQEAAAGAPMQHQEGVSEQWEIDEMKARAAARHERRAAAAAQEAAARDTTKRDGVAAKGQQYGGQGVRGQAGQPASPSGVGDAAPTAAAAASKQQQQDVAETAAPPPSPLSVRCSAPVAAASPKQQAQHHVQRAAPQAAPLSPSSLNVATRRLAPLAVAAEVAAAMSPGGSKAGSPTRELDGGSPLSSADQTGEMLMRAAEALEGHTATATGGGGRINATAAGAADGTTGLENTFAFDALVSGYPSSTPASADAQSIGPVASEGRSSSSGTGGRRSPAAEAAATAAIEAEAAAGRDMEEVVARPPSSLEGARAALALAAGEAEGERDGSRAGSRAGSRGGVRVDGNPFAVDPEVVAKARWGGGVEEEGDDGKGLYQGMKIVVKE